MKTAEEEVDKKPAADGSEKVEPAESEVYSVSDSIPFEIRNIGDAQLEAELNQIGRQTRRRVQSLTSDVLEARRMSLQRFANSFHQQAVRYFQSVESTTGSNATAKDLVRDGRNILTDWFLKHLGQYREIIQPNTEQIPQTLDAICGRPYLTEITEHIVPRESIRMHRQPKDSIRVRTGKWLVRVKAKISGKTPVRKVRVSDLSDILLADIFKGCVPVLCDLERCSFSQLKFLEEYLDLIEKSSNSLLKNLDNDGSPESPEAEKKAAIDTLQSALQSWVQKLGVDSNALAERLNQNFKDAFSNLVDNAGHDGTIEFDSVRARVKAQKELRRSTQDLKNFTKNHVRVVGAFIDSITAERYVHVLSHDVGKRLNSLISGIKALREKHINHPADSAIQVLEQQLETFRAELGSKSGFKTADVLQRRDAVTGTIQKAADSARELLDEELIDAEINSFLLALEEFANNTLDVEFALRDEDKSAEKRVKPSDFVELPLKNIVSSFLTRKNPAAVLNEYEKLRQEYHVYSTELLRFLEVIDFNIDLALSELETSGARGPESEDAKNLIIGAMDRIGIQTSELATNIGKTEFAFEKSISETIRSSLNKLRELVEEKDPVKINLHLFKGSSTHRAKDLQKRFMDSLRVSGRRARIFGLQAYRFVLRKKESISTRFGLEEFDKSTILAIKDRASLEKSISDKLPFIYRKLFKIEPLQAQNFLVGRLHHSNIVKQSFDRWKRNGESSLAIVGEVGSGKTSLINCSGKKLFEEFKVSAVRLNHTVFNEKEICEELSQSLEIDGCTSFRQLKTALMQGKKRTLILEDAENLYLRVVGGTAALKALLLLASETCKNVFWVFTFRKYGWNYLQKTMKISSYFYFDIETASLKKDEIEKVIMTRHNISGYKIHFELSDELSKNRRYKKARKEEDRQVIAQELYFEKLREISGGNIMLAIFYWLSSVDHYESSKVFIKDPSVLDFRFIEQLPMEHLHTLAALVQHSNLSIREHSMIFHNSVSHSMLTIEALETVGLVLKSNRFFGMDSPDEYYSINPVIYVETVKILLSKNLLT